MPVLGISLDEGRGLGEFSGQEVGSMKKNVEDFYDAKARVIRTRLDEAARQRGIEPDLTFSDAWESFLAQDMRKRAGVSKQRVSKVNECDNDRPLLRD